jgi:hypothetical protein
MSADTQCRGVPGTPGTDASGFRAAPGGSGRSPMPLLSFTHNVGSTCDLGLQDITLTPGASSTCTGSACSCSSCCCW